MDKLRKLRINSKITTTELGKAIGCSNQTITNYELGNRKPDPETLIKLANYFNVSVDYLLGRTKIDKNLEWTDEEKALGVGRYPTYLSEDDVEWLEIKSDIIEAHGEEYLKTVKQMLTALKKTAKK